MLAQAVTANIQGIHKVAFLLQKNSDLAETKICDFIRMNPPEFFGSKVNVVPQFFIDVVWKINQIMHVTKEESVELTSYRLKDVTYDWVVMWWNSRGENASPISWQIFQDTFLYRFFLHEIREAKVEEFMNLRQGSMIVKEYCLKFNQLAKYAPDLIADPRVSMRKFLTGYQVMC